MGNLRRKAKKFPIPRQVCATLWGRWRFRKAAKFTFGPAVALAV
jgi:hypothetical protein